MISSVKEFESTIQKTMAILKDVDETLGWGNRPHQAYAVLRAVLHAVRDRLMAEQAVHLGAQLPMLVRGFYYEGWKIDSVPIKMKKDEFLQLVRSQIVFSFDIPLESLITTVMNVLGKHAALGEIKKIKGSLPDELKPLMGDAE